MTTQWQKGFSSLVTWLLVLLLAVPPWAVAQEPDAETGAAKTFKQEELDQMLAPIALYPDSLLAQVLMASTYPLEVVQADRWTKQNKELEGDTLAEELEKQEWDPSVKSLVQFPDVLAMMSEKLDWTQKLGDAFLAQQEDVTNTVQNLRKKAKETDNLKTTKEQVVKVEKEVIIIESAKPEVVYVPVYNPTVVYGTWWWPHYPPYYYYPPYYPRPALYGFATGVAIGVAWGYAWGHWNWHSHSVNININRNINYNRNINRDRYAKQYGGREGQWKHNPEHRKGVSYRDRNTAQQYNRAASRDAVKSREDFRGRAEAGRKDLARDSSTRQASAMKDKPQSRDSVSRPGPETRDRSQSRDAVQSRDFNRSTGAQQTNRGNAFSGMNQGSASRNYSQRGSMSRSGGRSYGGGGGRGGGGRR
ncbi:MAG: hypothetical protein AMK70_08185 [Nitrospira bacterium SG8_35_1]|nr:MAG: hypothetical protein AMK70_08185 [Nitrospira bacterium SG8_35_1]